MREPPGQALWGADAHKGLTVGRARGSAATSGPCTVEAGVRAAPAGTRCLVGQCPRQRTRSAAQKPRQQAAGLWEGTHWFHPTHKAQKNLAVRDEGKT